MSKNQLKAEDNVALYSIQSVWSESGALQGNTLDLQKTFLLRPNYQQNT